jgi:hypothetical protein
MSTGSSIHRSGWSRLLSSSPTEQLAALSDDGLVLSGHYHSRHSSDEALVRPDSTLVRAPSGFLPYEWDDGAVGLLDAQTLSVETSALDPENARVNYNTLRPRPQHWVI